VVFFTYLQKKRTDLLDFHAVGGDKWATDGSDSPGRREAARGHRVGDELFGNADSAQWREDAEEGWRRAMPNDPRHYELPAPPELTADEVQDLGDRAAAELAEQKDAAHDAIRETYAQSRL
jgi:hypothetical protein